MIVARFISNYGVPTTKRTVVSLLSKPLDMSPCTPVCRRNSEHRKCTAAPRRSDTIHDNKQVTEAYEKLLNSDIKNVTDLVATDGLVRGGGARVLAVIRAAMAYGYHTDDICQGACWFKVSLAKVETRLREMHRYKMWGLPTLCSSEASYRKVVEIHRPSEQIIGTRLETLAELLDCSTDEIRECLKRSTALRRKPLYMLTQYIETMKQHSYTGEDIRADLSILTVNIPQSIERIHQMDAVKFRDFRECAKKKLTCYRVFFERAMQNYEEDRSALESCNSEDVVAYLCERLDWSRDDAARVYTRIPGCHNRPYYIKATLDLLIDEFRIAKEVIRWKCQLFNYSTKRHRRRLEILRDLGVSDDEDITSSLLLSEAQFGRRHSLSDSETELSQVLN